MTETSTIRIKELAAASASLEPGPEQRAQWQAAADAEVNAFLTALPSLTTYQAAPPELVAEFAQFERELGKHPDVAAILAKVRASVQAAGILTAGPGHLAFVPGGGLYIGAVADHLAATLNAFSADSFAAPIAVHLHEQALRWLTALIGYGESAWGDITSGGSHATLTAFFVARQAAGLKARDYEKTCVYLGAHTHHCCEKALMVLFGDELIVRVAPEASHIMDADWLREQIARDLAAGLKPWLVVATAGSTNLGRVDPLAELAAVAKTFGLWLHVDAACGGFFKLCPEAESLFSGVSEADSVVLDPHKGMFLPYGCGAVLFKDGGKLRRALSHSGVYLQDRAGAEQHSPMDYSLELTRPFRSFRLWLAICVHGRDSFRDALSEKLLLARHCREQLEKLPKLVMVGTLDLSIFAFRYLDPAHEGDSEAATRELLKRINRHPEVFLSSTRVDGHFVIRVAILSFRTHFETTDQLITIIRDEVEHLAGPYGVTPS